MAQTEFIYFDLGNVITFFSHDLASEQMALVAGTTKEKIEAAVFGGPLQVDYETGRIDSREFYDGFCATTGTSPDYDDLLRAGSDIFSLNTPVMPLLTQLRAIGFPLGVLSNTCPAHFEHLCKQFKFIDKGFSRYVLSYRAGAMKPNANIFKAAVDVAGCEAASIFFTDDRQENVDGAHAAGIDAVLFKSAAGLLAELVGRGVRINL